MSLKSTEIKDLVNDSSYDGEGRCLYDYYIVFKSIFNINYIVYANNNTIILFNLIENKTLTIKNAHNSQITNSNHYSDKKNKRDLILSLSNSDNNIKLWNGYNFECLYNFKDIYNKGYINSTCFLNYKENIYIITSNCLFPMAKCSGLFVYNLNGNFEKSIDNCSKSYDGVFYLNSYYDIELNKNYIITGNCGYCKSFDFEEGKLYNKYFDNDSYCMGLIIVKHLFIYNNDGKIKLIEINTLSNMKIWDFHSKELLTKIESKEEIFAACLWNTEYLLFGGKNCLIKVFDLSKKVIVDTLFNKDEKNNIVDIKVINHPLYGKSLIFLEGKIIKISKIVVE